MAKTLLPQHVQNPQLAQALCAHPNDPTTRLLMTVYTGSLQVNHFAGSGKTGTDILFPLVGPVADPTSPITSDIAILPLFEREELSAAVATVSTVTFVDKTDPAIAAAISVRADLRRVTLSPNTPVFAVVLSARVEAQNLEFRELGYQVTVFEKRLQSNPIRVSSSIWDGNYRLIGPILDRGVPQRDR